jgi:hypothetical protein
MMNKMTSRVIRVVAWVVAGGIVLQASCGVTIENAIVNATASFIGNYLSALLAQYLPTASA